MLSSNNFELQQFENLERAVHERKVAEDEFYKYVNSIVTAEILGLFVKGNGLIQIFIQAKRNLKT